MLGDDYFLEQLGGKWIGDVGGLQYRGAGGPRNLLEMVRIFREWVLQQGN